MSFIDHSYNKCISNRFLSWQHRCYNMIFVYPKLYYTMCGTTPFPMSVRHCTVIGGHRMVKIMSVDGREVCETISFSRNHAWYKPATSFCRVNLKKRGNVPRALDSRDKRYSVACEISRFDSVRFFLVELLSYSVKV